MTQSDTPPRDLIREIYQLCTFLTRQDFDALRQRGVDLRGVSDEDLARALNDYPEAYTQLPTQKIWEEQAYGLELSNGRWVIWGPFWHASGVSDMVAIFDVDPTPNDDWGIVLEGIRVP